MARAGSDQRIQLAAEIHLGGRVDGAFDFQDGRVLPGSDLDVPDVEARDVLRPSPSANIAARAARSRISLESMADSLDRDVRGPIRRYHSGMLVKSGSGMPVTSESILTGCPEAIDLLAATPVRME